jgi:hypothetical protein
MNTGQLRRWHEQELVRSVDQMLHDRSYEILEKNEHKQTVRARYLRNDWFVRATDETQSRMTDIKDVHDLSKMDQSKQSDTETPKPVISSGITGIQREWVYVNLVWCKPDQVKMNVEWMRECIQQCRASQPPAEHLIVLYDKPITKRIAVLAHERDSSAVPLFIHIEIWESKQLLYGLTQNELVQSARQTLLSFPESMKPERQKLAPFLERAEHTDAMVKYLGGLCGQMIQVVNRGAHGTYITYRVIHHDKREKVSSKESADVGEDSKE